jgi:hypothetical protein
MSGPIKSSDDDVSRSVAHWQAACDSDTSGSDHAVDDEDGSDSEVSMCCEFVDSMAAESRSVQSDEGATSADSSPCETDSYCKTRLYDSAMVTQIILKTEGPHGLPSDRLPAEVDPLSWRGLQVVSS